MPEFSCIEIRCDGRNDPSVAVARRLGFRRATPIESDAGRTALPVDHMQVWISERT
jgi:RimJ/RimL family protein N-acetyltransferase